jgi:methionyl-tRNA formyltransferase
MKILVVTSDVTFVPKNYQLFLESLIANLEDSDDIKIEVTFLRNNQINYLFKGLFLFLVGARNFAFHLCKNSIKAYFNDKTWLKEKKIPYTFFNSPNDREFHLFVENNKFDLIVNARTRYIYKKKILSLPKLGCLNIHHGLLPEKRGTMCDLWSLFQKEDTGFTIHKMERKIDDGDIVLKVITSQPNKNENNVNSDLRTRYLDIIEHSSQLEGKTLANLLKIINKTSVIPIELKNQTNQATYSKNPSVLEMRRMLNFGIKL